MKRWWVLVAAAAMVVAISGCSKGAVSGTPQAAGTTSSSAASSSEATASSTAASSTTAASTTADAVADLPEPCTLLSDAEVTSLTGRAITQIDKDGAKADSSTRYCQWQLEGGQLAVFLQQTTRADFDAANTAAEGAVPVTDVGDASYAASGHLYVLTGAIQIDAYVRGGSDDQDLADAKKVAAAVIPKLKS